jgi:hypothetical protein
MDRSDDDIRRRFMEAPQAIPAIRGFHDRVPDRFENGPKETADRLFIINHEDRDAGGAAENF